MGADGGIGGTYGAMPELFLKIYDLVSENRMAEARAIQYDADEIIYKLCSGTCNMYAMIKEVLRVSRGIDIGGVRKPLTDLCDGDRAIAGEAAAMIEAAKEKYCCYDLLANIGNYRGMNRNLDKAIDYLMSVDINTLPLGKTEIDGDRVFLQVMEARTHELTDESYEVHRDYMDIQIDIDGCEVIETALNGVTPIGEYRPDFQKAAACAGAGGRCVMGPGRFILCMAGEAHGPGGCLEQPEDIKKCVVKVAVADERP